MANRRAGLAGSPLFGSAVLADRIAIFEYSNGRDASLNPRTRRLAWPRLLESADAVVAHLHKVELQRRYRTSVSIEEAFEFGYTSVWTRRIWLDMLLGRRGKADVKRHELAIVGQE